MENYWTTEHVSSVTFGAEYARCFRDELMMAVVFNYRKPLIEKILSVSLPCEIPVLMDVVTWDYSINIEYNGNLTLAN